MSEAHIAQRGPYALAVEAGRDYWWCSCGRSASQPLCDGSHKGSPFTPVLLHALRSETLFFCGCKHSATPPLCDGSHQQL